MSCGLSVVSLDFYPRPPRGGRRGFLAGSWQRFSISIHALREEGDPFRSASFRRSAYFYPRPPRGGRHCWAKIVLNHVEISIHALREEGDTRAGARLQKRRISIHALREEGDHCPAAQQHRLEVISIHALREEGDHTITTPLSQRRRFLSTPSARRATRWRDTSRQKRAYFYPRPPRGGRRSSFERLTTYMTISIHALREEGDPGAADRTASADNFYPRPPRGGRPPAAATCSPPDTISIHALREEGDDVVCSAVDDAVIISIHALREEGDHTGPTRPPRCYYFYPRPPRGGRLRRFPCSCRPLQISIHALREEGDMTAEP